MTDSTDPVNSFQEYKPSLLLRFFMKIAGTRRRLGMQDFPGGWTDMVFVETFIKLSFMERIKVLFMGRLITRHYILCEKEPGKTKPTTQIFIGHPLDDQNYKLPKEERTE